MTRKTSGALFRFGALALLVVGVWLLSRYSHAVPTPLGRNAPLSVFSGARADETLRRLLGAEHSRSVDSLENAQARDRILQELSRLGVRNETQKRFYCTAPRAGRSIRCTYVTNIIGTVVEGEGPALVLTAHYDSVPAGPGASDDLSGVATILETIRALKAAKLVSRHPVLAIFTDGEEAGLMGMRALMESDAWRKRLGAVVNVEARGTGGQSILFQTSPGDARLISIYAGNVDHYATSSLFPLIYRLLPNDTDLTPVLNAGIPGMNFAFIEGAQRYHTALDQRRFLDPVTLQQHGESVLGVTSGLMQADFAALKSGDAIYLSIMGAWLPRMPASWALPLSLLVLIGTIVSLFLRADARADRKAWMTSLAVVPLVLLGVLLCGFLLHTIAALVSGSSAPAYAYPLALRLSLSIGVGAVILLVARLWKPRVPAGAVWVWTALFAVLTSIFLPGLSPYFLFPALIATPLLLSLPFLPNNALREAMVGLAAIPALFIWLGLTSQGEAIMGLMLHPIFTVTAGFAVIGLIPLLGLEALSTQSWRDVSGGLGAIALAIAILAGFQPSYSPDAPQRLNIQYIEDHTENRTYWSVDAVTPGLRMAATFSDVPRSVVPFNLSRGFIADAGAARLDAPSLQVSSDASGVMKLMAKSSGDPLSLTIAIPAKTSVSSVLINGRRMNLDLKSDTPLLITCLGHDCSRFSADLTVQKQGPLDVTLAEVRSGLPANGAKLIAARGNSAVQSQNGDVTVLLTKTRLP